MVSDAILPCLKEPSWVGGEEAYCRPLWTGERSPHIPWVAFGFDHPHSFEFLGRQRIEQLGKTDQTLEREALANLKLRAGSWQEVSVKLGWFKKLRLQICGDDFLAAERILDVTFMGEAQRRLKAPGLMVGIPRRGLLVAMSAAAALDDVKKTTALVTFVSAQFHGGESAPISPAVFAMKDGEIVGLIDSGAEAGKREDADAGNDDEGVPPYITILTFREDATGLESVDICAAGDDFETLAPAVVSALAQAMSAQASRAEFSGQVRLTVLGHTPPHVREQIPRLEEHLRGIINETRLSTASGAPVSLTVRYQRDLLSGS